MSDSSPLSSDSSELVELEPVDTDRRQEQQQQQHQQQQSAGYEDRRAAELTSPALRRRPSITRVVGRPPASDTVDDDEDAACSSRAPGLDVDVRRTAAGLDVVETAVERRKKVGIATRIIVNVPSPPPPPASSAGHRAKSSGRSDTGDVSRSSHADNRSSFTSVRQGSPVSSSSSSSSSSTITAGKLS